MYETTATGQALKYCGISLRSDREIVLTAVRHDGRSLGLAGKLLMTVT
jgi:hypothetical protein